MTLNATPEIAAHVPRPIVRTLYFCAVFFETLKTCSASEITFKSH